MGVIFLCVYFFFFFNCLWYTFGFYFFAKTNEYQYKSIWKIFLLSILLSIMDERKTKTPPPSRKTAAQPSVPRRASELLPSSAASSSFTFNYRRPLTPPILKLVESPTSTPLDTPTQSLSDLTTDSATQDLKCNEENNQVLADVFEDNNGNESIVLYVPERSMESPTIELTVEL